MVVSWRAVGLSYEKKFPWYDFHIHGGAVMGHGSPQENGTTDCTHMSKVPCLFWGVRVSSGPHVQARGDSLTSTFSTLSLPLEKLACVHQSQAGGDCNMVRDNKQKLGLSYGQEQSGLLRGTALQKEMWNTSPDEQLCPFLMDFSQALELQILSLQKHPVYSIPAAIGTAKNIRVVLDSSKSSPASKSLRDHSLSSSLFCHPHFNHPHLSKCASSEHAFAVSSLVCHAALWATWQNLIKHGDFHLFCPICLFKQTETNLR